MKELKEYMEAKKKANASKWRQVTGLRQHPRIHTERV